LEEEGEGESWMREIEKDRGKERGKNDKGEEGGRENGV